MPFTRLTYTTGLSRAFPGSCHSTRRYQVELPMDRKSAIQTWGLDIVVRNPIPWVKRCREGGHKRSCGSSDLPNQTYLNQAFSLLVPVLCLSDTSCSYDLPVKCGGIRGLLFMSAQDCFLSMSATCARVVMFRQRPLSLAFHTTSSLASKARHFLACAILF